MISIIIPLYNGIEYLDIAINSVINQTYENWEVIIGINGHEKNSDIEKQANEISKLDHKNRIKVLWFNEKGAQKTLNKLVKIAKYDYISLLDADDFWFKTKLEQQMKYIDKYDVIGTGCHYIGDKEGQINIPLGDLGNLSNLFWSNPLIHSSILMKKNDVNFSEKILYDYDLWFKLSILKNKKFFNVPKILTFHRIHSESFFNGTNSDSLSDLKKYWKKRKKRYEYVKYIKNKIKINK